MSVVCLHVQQSYTKCRADAKTTECLDAEIVVHKKRGQEVTTLEINRLEDLEKRQKSFEKQIDMIKALQEGVREETESITDNTDRSRLAYHVRV